MIYIIRVLILFLGLLKFSAPALAGGFSSEMEEVVKVCSGGECSGPYLLEHIYDHNQGASGSALAKKLKAVAQEQAHIWADTILEGDYVADGKTRLDKAVAIYKYDKLLAYFITYSERAWDTSTCLYDALDDATLARCKRGRIVESVYLSPDFSDYYFADENYARFVEK